jgi:3,4-dihydroxy 2-butanone 4-phosphate synthase/GTP cyclohydrolase II
MSSLPEALNHLKQGGMILLMDDETRENEGDLVIAAEFATPQAINFMAMHGRGLICLALTGAQVDRLGLDPMTDRNRARRSTAFTVSIEAREGITTGISAYDRSHTILTACNPDVRPDDIVSPGHVFPLRADDGGVLKRDGHTEGSVDLMKLAGLTPAAVICEVMADSGHMAHGQDLQDFAKKHKLPVLTIRQVIDHRIATEIWVEDVASADLPSSFSEEPMKVHAFRSLLNGTEHLAMVRRPFGANPLVRLHSECLTGDALGSLKCDCGQQLQESLRLISDHPDGGAVIYLRDQEGRGIGLANKIRTYALQEQGFDTLDANIELGFPADGRDYAIAAQIVKALGIQSVRLLSNNPHKAQELERYGVTVTHRDPLVIAPNPFNHDYLATKTARFGHTLKRQ